MPEKLRSLFGFWSFEQRQPISISSRTNKLVGGTKAGRGLPRMFDRYKDLGVKSRERA